ncbi:MAG: SBBP repeat-containing protein, partial [Acidimicrobiales bacterium]|nr:SBBP repeat-containing protein [Acidimicrobiales bacterium]
TGYFQGTVDLGAGDVTSAGSNDVFVTKLNAAGVHQWTTTLGGTNDDRPQSVAVDGSGNVHVTGYFQGTVDFGAGDVTSAGSADVFVVKLNSAGQAVVAPGGGGTPPPPPPPCPWPTATYATEPGCVEPLKGGISVDADGTLFTVGNLDVTGVTIDLEDGETATDIELVSGGTTTGYVLTSKQRIIGFGDTPATDPDGTDLVTLWPGETVTQLSNNRNGTYFVTSHGRVFDINGNPYVDLSRYVTTNNIVDIKTLDTGSGILIGADGAVFSFGLDLFQGSLGGQGIIDIIGGHLVPGGYYLLSATGTIHTFGDIAIAPDITALTTKVFDTETLNGRLIDVTPAGTGLCALGADGGLFDMLGAQHNTTLRAHTNPNTTAIDTTG